jgi:hypothetical protein
MSWLEKRSPLVRWLLVIPAAIGAAVLGNLAPSLLDFSGHAAAGDFGGLVAFVLAPFISAFFGGYVFVTGPAQVAPRGRTAVASVMVSLVVIGAAIGIITVATGHNRSIYPSWWWIASGVLTLVAGVFGVIEIATKKADHRTPTPGYSPFVTVPTRDEEDADDEPADPWGEIQATGIEVRPGIAVEPGDVLRYGGAGVGRFVGTQTYEGKNFALLRYADSQTLFIPMDKTNAFEKVSDSTPLDRLPKNDAGDS